MLQTLFHIPSSWLGIPGVIAWCLICAVWLVAFGIRDAVRKEGKLLQEFLGMLPVLGTGIVVIFFLLPNMQVRGVDPANPVDAMVDQGLAIRGYGVMLMLAVMAGMALALIRCPRLSISREHLFQLAIWMIGSGLVGARLFFVIQNRANFFPEGATFAQVMGAIFNMAEGGLVVFGSLIGALLGGAFVIWRRKLPLLATADLVAPAMAIGLSIGRIGCLMNGCCWGGVCDAPLPVIQFPAGSPPWVQHLYQGQLLGLKTRSAGEDPDSLVREIVEVKDGIGAELGLEVGDVISVRALEAERLRFLVGDPRGADAAKELIFAIESQQQGILRVPLNKLPSVSRAVHPTQIYSSINALILCLFLWCYWYVRKADGEVIALMLVLYSVSRFLLELIRNDELGQFGTDLTISQIVSLGALVAGISLFFWCRMFGKRMPEVPLTPKNT